jgi:alpha-tubulin suppressor-like RCC1 family protein
MPETRDFVTVAGGGEHTGGSVLGIKSDGTVWEWGRTLGPVSRPACEHQIPNLAGVKAVDVGGTHAVALMPDGTVWSWGMNNNLELGGSRPAGDEPAPVAGLDQVTALAAGGAHTLALRRDGTVWAWGQNIFGQLGDGTRANMGPPPHGRGRPAPVKGLADVIAIAAGGSHSLALKRDGTVDAWGSNQYGALGNGTTQHAAMPVPVRINRVVAIAAGNDFSVALRDDGSVWAWGANNWGQLGDATRNQRTTPAPIADLARVRRIVTGGVGGVALRDDGAVWVWGLANYAAEGRSKPEPQQVAFLRGPVESVAIGGKFTVVARPDGSLWYWGTRPGFLAPSFDDNGRAAQAAYQPTLTPLCGTGGGQG